MLFNVNVSDIDTSADKYKSDVFLSTNIADVFIPARITGYDDTEVLSVIYMFRLFSMKEV